MTFVHQPPTMNLMDVLSNDEEFLNRAMASPEFSLAIRRANTRYLHWDQFRHRPLPSGFSHENSWTYLKFLRRSSLRAAPFADKENKPFQFSLPDEAQRVLSQIDRWAGDSLETGIGGPLPSRERYIVSSLMEEAIASSQLEGAATTRVVAKEMLRSGRAPRDKSEQMIVNNWHSIQHLRACKNQPLTPQLICEIQALLTQKTMQNVDEIGRFRARDDVVVTWHDRVVHEPPRASTLTARMDALCHFANNDADEPWIHPIVKAAMLHFWLAYDHPFADGNGRTARALVYWYLLSRGYWLFEYMAISRLFLKAPAQYGRAYLYTETDEGDLTYFLMLNLRVIHLAFEELRLYIQRKNDEIASAVQSLQSQSGLNGRQRQFLAHVARHPDGVFTVENYRKDNNVVYQTARQDLLSLVEKGWLHQSKRGKAFVFFASPDLAQRLGEAS